MAPLSMPEVMTVYCTTWGAPNWLLKTLSASQVAAGRAGEAQPTPKQHLESTAGSKQAPVCLTVDVERRSVDSLAAGAAAHEEGISAGHEAWGRRVVPPRNP